MEKIPLLCRGKRIGEAEAERQSLYLCLRVRTVRREGLWRAWAVGTAGELRIGALEPLGTEAAISRRFSSRSLAPIGKLLHVELRPESVLDKADVPSMSSGSDFPTGAPSASAWKSAGENPLQDFRFRRQIQHLQNVLECREKERRYLAFPAGNAFPLPELFCFARARRIGGRNYWVFAFDQRQHPVL